MFQHKKVVSQIKLLRCQFHLNFSHSHTSHFEHNPIKNISRQKLCYVRLERSDWTFKIFQPIRLLQTSNLTHTSHTSQTRKVGLSLALSPLAVVRLHVGDLHAVGWDIDPSKSHQGQSREYKKLHRKDKSKEKEVNFKCLHSILAPEKDLNRKENKFYSK